MKITNNGNLNVLKIYNSSKTKIGSIKDKEGSRGDSIEISSKGMEVARLLSIAKSIPDVRAEKVADLKSRIENGTYKPSSEDIAAKIMDEINKEKI